MHHVWMFMDETDIPEASVERITMLRDLLLDRASGEYPSEPFYAALRRRVLADPAVPPAALPAFVGACDTLARVGQHLKRLSRETDQRCAHIERAFAPILAHLASGATAEAASDGAVSAATAAEAELILRGASPSGSGEFAVYWNGVLAGQYRPGGPLRADPEFRVDEAFRAVWDRLFPAAGAATSPATTRADAHERWQVAAAGVGTTPTGDDRRRRRPAA